MLFSWCLKCPYYGLWKVHILIFGVPNNSLTCIQDQKTLPLSYNMHLFFTLLAQWLPKRFAQWYIFSESSFKYLGVNISEDLTWTAHIQTQVKKARQRLYHLQQLRKFRVSPAILKTFYSGAIEIILTQFISVWYGNISNQDYKALQRVVRIAERISGSALPSLQDIYLKRCKSRAAKIIKDSNHPCNRLFNLLPSGKRFRSMMAKTERLRMSFFPQAIRLLNSNSNLVS